LFYKRSRRWRDILTALDHQKTGCRTIEGIDLCAAARDRRTRGINEGNTSAFEALPIEFPPAGHLIHRAAAQLLNTLSH